MVEPDWIAGPVRVLSRAAMPVARTSSISQTSGPQIIGLRRFGADEL
jgi:hypothetical protein